MKILVADDDPIICQLLTALLTGWGYEVMIAHDGEGAWEILQGADAPRMAILDWMMPGRLDGLEVCRNVRWRATSDIAYIYIILATANHTEDSIMEGIAAGADDYLAKPFKSQELKARLLAGKRVLSLEEALRGALAEQKATERELKEERNMLRTIIDTLPDSIYVKDAEGRYVLDNAAHMRQLGAISEEEVRGKTVHDFFPPELADRFHSDDQTVFRSGRPILDKKELIQDRYGRNQWIVTSKIPIWDSKGKIVGLVCISEHLPGGSAIIEDVGSCEAGLVYQSGDLSPVARR
jgi:PAS domain S-box-containing protein